MTYQIVRSDGSYLTMVQDNSVNTTTLPITLFGKGFLNYGEGLNDNFVALLENFASPNPPVNATRGQLWYDDGNQVMKVLNPAGGWDTIVSSSSAQNSGALQLYSNVSISTNLAVGGILTTCVDASHYGVVGDGVTDDYPALQEALNATAGKCILNIPVTMLCMLSQQLSVPAQSHVTQRGGLKLLASSGILHSVVDVRGSNVKWDGCCTGYIDGNRAAQTGSGNSSAGIGSGAASISNVYVCDLEIRNVVNWPVNFTNGINNVVVERCYLHDCGDSAEINKAVNSGFRGCIVANIQDDGLVLYGACVSCFIESCTVTGCETAACILSDDAQAGQCLNNRIVNTVGYANLNTGIFVCGTDANPVINTVVSGNQCYGNGPANYTFCNVNGLLVAANFAAGVTQAANGFDIVLVGFCDNVTVSTNQLYGSATNSIVGIIIQGVTGTPTITIENNLFVSVNGLMTYGIYCPNNTNCSRVVVRDNTAAGVFLSDFFADATGQVNFSGDRYTGNVPSSVYSMTRSLATPSVIVNQSTPASSSSAAISGQITFDANYAYFATGTNSWKRVPLSAF